MAISPQASFILILTSVILLFVIVVVVVIVVTLLFRLLLQILQGKFGRIHHRQKVIDIESPRQSDCEGPLTSVEHWSIADIRQCAPR